MANYKQILEDIHGEVRNLKDRGKVADYIPALAQVDAKKFGMAIRTLDGEQESVGDADEHFSIQSISKMFALEMALKLVGDDIWKRVGREPSGDPFNSLVQLEHEHGIPRNPMINAGAIVVSDCLASMDDSKTAVVEYLQMLSGDPEVAFDLEVARSEADHGYLNHALANYLKSHDNLHNDVEQVLDLYFHQCSLTMNCGDRLRACLHLAAKGFSRLHEKQILTPLMCRRTNAIMLTCGLYDAVGNFAYRVGLPAKSGVGGGIVAVLPNEYCAAVWSPGLDRWGNSLVGTAALEMLTIMTGNSIF